MDTFFEMNFWEMILRSTLSFIALLILARILGKKQLSQLTFFHYITGITVGSIAAEIASQHETPFLAPVEPRPNAALCFRSLRLNM